LCSYFFFLRSIQKKKEQINNIGSKIGVDVEVSVEVVIGGGSVIENHTSVNPIFPRVSFA
jgi:hypothetical protein